MKPLFALVTVDNLTVLIDVCIKGMLEWTGELRQEYVFHVLNEIKNVNNLLIFLILFSILSFNRP